MSPSRTVLVVLVAAGSLLMAGVQTAAGSDDEPAAGVIASSQGIGVGAAAGARGAATADTSHPR